MFSIKTIVQNIANKLFRVTENKLSLNLVRKCFTKMFVSALADIEFRVYFLNKTHSIPGS